MKKTIAVLSFAVVVLAAGGWGAHRIYENHLNSDLKTTLSAAVAYDVSDEDVLSYQRTARLQIRTDRDKAEFGKFERMFNLAKSASDERQASWKHTMDGISSMNSGACGWMNMGHTDQATLDNCKSEIDLDKSEAEYYKNADKQAEQDAKRALELHESLRSDLGMPTLNTMRAEILKRLKVGVTLKGAKEPLQQKDITFLRDEVSQEHDGTRLQDMLDSLR